MIDITTVQQTTAEKQGDVSATGEKAKPIIDALDKAILAVANASGEVFTATIYVDEKNIKQENYAMIKVDEEPQVMYNLLDNIKRAYNEHGYTATGAYSNDFTNYYLTIAWSKEQDQTAGGK